MATYKFLDKKGTTYLWQRLVDLIPSEVSQLTNDKDYVSKYEVFDRSETITEILNRIPFVPDKVTELSDGDNYVTKRELANAFKHKGSVRTMADLPTSGNTLGDIYYVESEATSFMWSGNGWNSFGSGSFDEALSNAEIDDILEDD